ncbi:MAG: (d)CMP kinase [Anaerolineaceae bacterium]|nr:(d)CMP kinase [Anaerolineaceae bacterium]
MTNTKTIAIDGPAASGKSTVGEILAKKLGYLYFDTGVMYRVVTLAALRALSDVGNEAAVSEIARQIDIDARPPTVDDGRLADVLLNGEDVTWEIRKPEVNANVSQVSAYPIVREEMTAQQRRIGQRGAVVMVGRDIGTVVMPNADKKFYIDASAEVRAERRYKEEQSRGGRLSYDEILESIKHRDLIDSTRKVAPLRPAEDAIRINTDSMSIDAVLDELLKHCSSF